MASPVNRLAPTYEEMANNPVGWSSVYPPQYVGNASNAPPADYISDVRMPGASRNLLASELAAIKNYSIDLFNSLGNMVPGGGSAPVRMAGSVRGRGGLPPLPQQPISARRGLLTGGELPPMDNAMAVAGMTSPIAKVDANWLRAAIKDRGLDFTEKHSTSWSDIHGPSASQYFKVGDKTIRLSDHTYGPGNASDLRYGMDATRAAQELDYALGIGPRQAPISDPLRDSVYGMTKKQLNAALDSAGIKNVSNVDKESMLLKHLRLNEATGNKLAPREAQ